MIFLILWIICMVLFYVPLGNLLHKYFDDLWSGYDMWHMSNLEYRYYRWSYRYLVPIFFITILTFFLWIIASLIIG